MVQEAISAQKDKITQLQGDITPETIDQLEEQLGAIAVTIKTHHYTEGGQYGHLACVIPTTEYAALIGNAAWVDVPPVLLDAYDPTALVETVGVRARKEAVWNRKKKDFETYTGVCEGVKELILYGAGEEAVMALKKRYIGYGGVTPKAMITYLREKACVKMTTLEKYNFKAEGYKAPWDTSKPIATYFKYLDEFYIKLTTRGIDTTLVEKATAAVAQMWNSGFFTEEKLIEWEKKAAADQTYANVETFFGELYHDHTQYSRATAKRARFNESANSIRDKKVAVEEKVAKQDDAAMMFSMMAEQHQEQLNQMRESNKAAMELAQQSMKQMAAQMAMMCGKIAKQTPTDNAYTAVVDKENAPPNTKKKLGINGEEAKLCKNCGKLGFHKPSKYHTLPENAEAKVLAEAKWKMMREKRNRGNK